MQMRAHILFPFDLGLELDFQGPDAQEMFKQVSSRKTADIHFENRLYPNASVTTQIYKFGVGSIEIAFDADLKLAEAARLSCFTENIFVGKVPIVKYCQGHVTGVIQQASQYADYRYEKRLEDVDLLPVFVIGETLPPGDAREEIYISESFMKRHQKELYGIVAGEPHYEELSSFVLKNEKIQNYGYYENEMILIERFGAMIYSEEASTVLGLVKLGYAQYWSLRAYNFLLDGELDNAQHVLEKLPPYYKFWAIPRQYQRFSKEAMDFGRDRLAIVESLYSAAGPNIPRIDADWHLRALYASIRKVFTIDDLYKTVETKLERIGESYNSAREFLSTNFFILLDIVFFASLLWSIIDTWLLWKLSRH